MKQRTPRHHLDAELKRLNVKCQADRCWSDEQVAALVERAQAREHLPPPGTETMTCHLHDGSTNHACSNAPPNARGSRHLPTVDCTGCLVFADWAIEHGIYVVKDDGYIEEPGHAYQERIFANVDLFGGRCTICLQSYSQHLLQGGASKREA